MYSVSTHKKFWTFENAGKLDELRREAREKFMKRLADPVESATAQKVLLTVDEERMFRSMVEENALKFCRSFDPPLPTRVIYTAFVLFKRFYVNTSLLRYLNAKNIMTAIIYLASKIEDAYIPIDTFVSKLKSGRPEDNVAMIRNLEPTLIKRLCSHLVVHEPFTPLEGLYILLMQSFPEYSKHDRDIRAASENFLWNSLITDASLLYSPSQIALTAIFAALKEENMEPFERLVEMALHGEDSEKANRLTAKVRECYSLVSGKPAVPPEFGKRIQKRINECVELVNGSLSARQTAQATGASSESESSSDFE